MAPSRCRATARRRPEWGSTTGKRSGYTVRRVIRSARTCCADAGRSASFACLARTAARTSYDPPNGNNRAYGRAIWRLNVFPSRTLEVLGSRQFRGVAQLACMWRTHRRPLPNPRAARSHGPASPRTRPSCHLNWASTVTSSSAHARSCPLLAAPRSTSVAANPKPFAMSLAGAVRDSRALARGSKSSPDSSGIT